LPDFKLICPICCDIYWKTPLKFIEDVCVNIFIITLDIFIKVILDEMSFGFSSHIRNSEAFARIVPFKFLNSQ